MEENNLEEKTLDLEAVQKLIKEVTAFIAKESVSYTKEIGDSFDEKKKAEEYTIEEFDSLKELLKETKKQIKAKAEEEMKVKVIEAIKEMKAFNEKNPDDKVSLANMKNEKLKESFKKKLSKKQFGKVSEKELKEFKSIIKKATEDIKKKKELESALNLLKEEGIEIKEDMSDEDIVAKAKEIESSPRFPFEVRIYGDDQASKFDFKSGKRYTLKDIKTIVIEEYFELKKASFEYDKGRNAVYVVMASSQKG